jgi:hypothetical protein
MISIEVQAVVIVMTKNRRHRIVPLLVSMDRLLWLAFPSILSVCLQIVASVVLNDGRRIIVSFTVVDIGFFFFLAIGLHPIRQVFFSSIEPPQMIQHHKWQFHMQKI